MVNSCFPFRNVVLISVLVFARNAVASFIGFFPCQDNSECDSGNCWEGVCQCNPNTTANIFVTGSRCPPETHECVGNATTGFYCALHANSTSILPIGSTCFGNCQCETLFCFNGGDVLLPGACRCHPRTNAGCPEGYTCVTAVEGDMMVNPSCYLDVGSECNQLNDSSSCPFANCHDGLCNCCYTGNCHEGICKCLPVPDFHNSGCSQGKYCSWAGVDSYWTDVDASCEDKKPAGAECGNFTMAIDCESGHCVDGACLGVECRPFVKDSGCPENQSCLGSSEDDKYGREGPFDCKVRSPVGQECKNFTDCETGICFDGICQCRPGDYWEDYLNDCKDDEYCIGLIWGYDGWEGPFFCERKVDDGSPCVVQDGINKHCQSGRCDDRRGVCESAHICNDLLLPASLRDRSTTVPPTISSGTQRPTELETSQPSLPGGTLLPTSSANEPNVFLSATVPPTIGSGTQQPTELETSQPSLHAGTLHPTASAKEPNAFLRATVPPTTISSGTLQPTEVETSQPSLPGTLSPTASANEPNVIVDHFHGTFRGSSAQRTWLVSVETLLPSSVLCLLLHYNS